MNLLTGYRYSTVNARCRLAIVTATVVALTADDCSPMFQDVTDVW